MIIFTWIQFILLLLFKTHVQTKYVRSFSTLVLKYHTLPINLSHFDKHHSFHQLLLLYRSKQIVLPLLLISLSSTCLLCGRNVRVVHKVGRVRPKWDKSGTFISIRSDFSTFFAHFWKKIKESHLGLMWPTLRPTPPSVYVGGICRLRVRICWLSRVWRWLTCDTVGRRKRKWNSY